MHERLQQSGEWRGLADSRARPAPPASELSGAAAARCEPSDRYAEAVAAVRKFFVQFYGDDIEQSVDAETAALVLRVGKDRKVVAVSADFLADGDAIDVRERLAGWNVAHLTRTLERGCRLNVTSDGPEEERP